MKITPKEIVQNRNFNMLHTTNKVLEGSQRYQSFSKIFGHFTIFFVFLSLLFSIACVTTEITQDSSNTASNYRKEIITILELFDRLVLENNSSDALSRSYRNSRSSIAEGKIRFQSYEAGDPINTERSIVQYREPNLLIYLHSSILQNSPPIAAMSEIARSLPYIEKFLEEEISNLFEDPLSYYLTQMDSVLLQSVFIEKYASRTYSPDVIPEFDNFLVQSRQVDNFSSYSLFVLETDREIIYSLLALSSQFAKGDVTIDYYIDSYTQLGQEIIDNISNNPIDSEGEGSEFDFARREIYITATSADTYQTLGSKIFSDALAEISQEDFERFENFFMQIEGYYDRMARYVEESKNLRESYRSEYVKETLN